MADLTESESTDLQHEPLQSEPLRSALKVQLPPPKPSSSPRAVPPPAAVPSIDRLRDYHRLKAALRADAELALITREVERRSGNPGVVERFVAVLGAWASTRQDLGLCREARLASFLVTVGFSFSFGATQSESWGVGSSERYLRRSHVCSTHLPTRAGISEI